MTVNNTSVTNFLESLYMVVCVTGMSTSARLVEQVLDRRQDQQDQFGSMATRDALLQSLASLLPPSVPGEQPGQYVNSNLACFELSLVPCY